MRAISKGRVRAPRATLAPPHCERANQRPATTAPTTVPLNPRTARGWSIWNGCCPMDIASGRAGAGMGPYASHWPVYPTRSRRAAGRGGAREVRPGGGGGKRGSPAWPVDASLRHETMPACPFETSSKLGNSGARSPCSNKTWRKPKGPSPHSCLPDPKLHKSYRRWSGLGSRNNRLHQKRRYQRLTQ